MHELHRAAIRAAHITDRRYANVLDVVGPEPDGELVIITEWLPSLALPEVLREPMTPMLRRPRWPRPRGPSPRPIRRA